MDIQYLTDFVEVAQCRTLTDAARRIGITQSAMSKRIMRMEAELGVPLFTREASEIRLTPEGESLSQCALGITNLYRNTLNSFKRKHNRPTVRIGGMLHDQRINALLCEVEASDPSFDIERDERPYDLSGAPLEKNELDVMFAPATPQTCFEGKACTKVIVKSEGVVAAIRSDNPLAQKPVLGVSDLKSSYLIRLLDNHATDDGWRAIEAMCTARGFLPKVNIVKADEGFSLRDAVMLMPESKVTGRMPFSDTDVRFVPVLDGFTFDLFMYLSPLMPEHVAHCFTEAAEHLRDAGGEEL